MFTRFSTFDMAYEFKYNRLVQFADTDMAGIMHFSNFFRFMECAEHAFYRSLGFGVHHRSNGALISWPRVRAECEYISPARFEDNMEVHLLVRQKNQKSLSFNFTFRKLGDESHEIARGALTVVCCAIDEQSRRMQAVPIPGPIAAKIEVAPPELLAERT